MGLVLCEKCVRSIPNGVDSRDRFFDGMSRLMDYYEEEEGWGVLSLSCSILTHLGGSTLHSHCNPMWTS
jgi:hypothetical protein